MIKALGIGENSVDRYLKKGLIYPGGCSLNFSVYTSKLGACSAYIGVLGSDGYGVFLKNILKEKGIDFSRCRTKNGSNSYFDVEIVNGERVFPNWDAGVIEKYPLNLTQDDLNYINTFSLVHTGYTGHIDNQLPLLKNRNFILIYDFSTVDCINGTTLLKNVAPYIDLALFSCSHMNSDDISVLIKKSHSAGAKYILATMGERGQIFSDGMYRYVGLATNICAIDTLGAGDAFVAAFALTMARDGWKRSNSLNPEIINRALDVASRFSAEICLIDGAFGCSQKM